jgi:hypothetical protein
MFLSSDKEINSAGSLDRAIPCFESSFSHLKMETEPISKLHGFENCNKVKNNSFKQ